MPLPGFRKRRPAASASSLSDSPKEGSLEARQTLAKRLTRARRNTIVFASFFYLLAFVFLVLVEIGNTKGTHVLGDIFFFKLDLSEIMASSVSSSATLTLSNSIARTLGLHDFYQVGLWNYCEGYDDEGITYCSSPQSLYWFNPVEILQGELFSGATIALPSEVNTILTVLRIVSQLMFGFFLTGTVLSFVLMCAGPVVLYSRIWSLPFALLGLISTILVVAAAGVATAMALIFKYALTSQTDLNISVDIGTKMFAFMWMAAIFKLIAFFVHASLGCFCTSRRDLRTGRKNGRGLPPSVAGSLREKKPKPGSQGSHLPTFRSHTATTSSV